MKRYAVLFAFTLLALGSILLAGKTAIGSIPRVDFLTVQPMTEEESVVCTGKVEEISDGNVFAPTSAVAKKVYVKAGDRVSKGQALMVLSVPSQTGEARGAGYDAIGGEEDADTAENGATVTLTAPTGGTITSVSVIKTGSLVGTDKPAVTIQSSSGLQIRLNISESQIAEIKVGQKVQITGVGFRNSTYSGTVKEIASEAKQVVTSTGQTTVVEVVVGIDHPGDDIKPGFTAKAKIITTSDASILIAPYQAVQADESGNEYVFRLVGNKAVKTSIVTGMEFDGGFEVKKGLSQGDRVLYDARDTTDGEHVIPAKQKAVSEE